MTDVLAELGFEHPRWMRDGNCHHMDTNVFFPGRGANAANRAAKAICVGCPVRETCLDYALDNGIQHGIWGGKSERERRAMRNGPRRYGLAIQNVARCGTPSGYEKHRREHTLICAACREAKANYNKGLRNARRGAA